jgi:hypothetical protein
MISRHKTSAYTGQHYTERSGHSSVQWNGFEPTVTVCEHTRFETQRLCDWKCNYFTTISTWLKQVRKYVCSITIGLVLFVAASNLEQCV